MDVIMTLRYPEGGTSRICLSSVKYRLARWYVSVRLLSQKITERVEVRRSLSDTGVLCWWGRKGRDPLRRRIRKLLSAYHPPCATNNLVETIPLDITLAYRNITCGPSGV